jgi:hypothetical protein
MVAMVLNFPQKFKVLFPAHISGSQIILNDEYGDFGPVGYHDRP